MANKKIVSINDPIHSRITLSDIERSVIDHSIFQRLRRVKALGLLEKTFPSARHSRFEHSIGVSYVAGEILTALLRNHAEIDDLSKWTPGTTQLKPWKLLDEFLSQQRKQQIKIAALLHDIGHGPFSHASEKIMPTRTDLINANPTIPDYLKDALRDITAANVADKKEQPDNADHEDYSLLLAWKILADIQPKHADINDSYIKDVLSFKFESVKPSNISSEEQFSLFRRFVSGDFDSDRMDYLLRDSYFCGVPYGKYDLHRLLEGLYVLENGGKLKLGLKKSSLSAFEDFLVARFQMHSQVYSHKMDGAFNSAFTETSKACNFHLPAAIEEYAQIDDECYLYANGLKASTELKNLLLNREKWIQVFETRDPKSNEPDDLKNLITEKIGEGFCAVNKSKREFRDNTVLDIPIVATNADGNFEIKTLNDFAHILKSNAVFFIKRIFVHPSKAEDAVEIVRIERSKISQIAKDVAQAEEHLEKASNNKEKKDVGRT